MINFQGCCVHKFCKVNDVFYSIHQCSVRCTSRLQPFLFLLLISREPVVFALVEMPVAWPLMCVGHVMNEREPLLFQNLWIITTAFCRPPQMVDYRRDPWCQVQNFLISLMQQPVSSWQTWKYARDQTGDLYWDGWPEFLFWFEGVDQSIWYPLWYHLLQDWIMWP